MLINAPNTLWANQSRQVVPSECLMQAPSYLMCFIYFPHSQQVNQNTKWEGLQEGGFPPPICVTSTNIKLNVNHSIFFSYHSFLFCISNKTWIFVLVYQYQLQQPALPALPTCFSCSASQQTKVRRLFADINPFYRHIYCDNSKTCHTEYLGNTPFAPSKPILNWPWIVINLKTFNITWSTHFTSTLSLSSQVPKQERKNNLHLVFLHDTQRKVSETILFLHRSLGNFLLNNRWIEKL